ncbi:MAG TPA: CvpA family protein [Candidatus Acidoferrum sp.]|jgi:uncharacterized membrane protein required for colicin V production|nr:CvpA family protein [Candidatus Acidoferrum sp.]
MNLNSLPINLFDVVVLGVLALGLLTGRKHGMSEELMNLVKWLAVIVGCALLYDPVGHWLAQSSPFSLLASFLFVYAIGALVILGLFALFKHQLGGKLIGSDIFGRSEYYLGMGSGIIRCSCMLLAVLALLNARYFTPTEVRAMENFQNDVYGANYFPTWHTAQEVVFEKSLTGPWIKANLGFLLIRPTQPEDKQYHQKEAALP